MTLRGSPYRLGISWKEDPAEPRSVLVSRVVSGSAADAAGVRHADRILEVNRRPFRNGSEMHAMVNASGDRMILLLERRGRLREVTIEFGGAAEDN